MAPQQNSSPDRNFQYPYTDSHFGSQDEDFLTLVAILNSTMKGEEPADLIRERLTGPNDPLGYPKKTAKRKVTKSHRHQGSKGPKLSTGKGKIAKSVFIWVGCAVGFLAIAAICYIVYVNCKSGEISGLNGTAGKGGGGKSTKSSKKKSTKSKKSSKKWLHCSLRQIQLPTHPPHYDCTTYLFIVNS